MQPQSQIEETTKLDITVRPLKESDLPTADAVMPVSYTHLTLPTIYSV